MPPGPRVSLLLPNRNNAPVLDLVLERLAQTTTYPDVEVVVVDDGSTDDSRTILRRWRDAGRFPRFQLVEKENSGVVETLNRALATATGEVCVQLDADASLETPGWVERMLGLLQADPRVGVVTAKVVIDWGELHACGVDLLGPEGFRDRPAQVLEPPGRRRWHFKIARVREGAGGDAERLPAEVDAGIGACMMYRRADALEVGGYDDGFAPVWFDDVDLCVAIRRLGHKVFYLPDVRVVHHLGKRPPPPGARSRRSPRQVARAVARRVDRRLPLELRRRIATRVDLDDGHSPEQRARARHHYAYWREKWGWDMLNPDLAEVRRRWGDTELWWAHDPARRAAGEEILAAHAQRRAAVASAR